MWITTWKVERQSLLSLNWSEKRTCVRQKKRYSARRRSYRCWGDLFCFLVYAIEITIRSDVLCFRDPCRFGLYSVWCFCCNIICIIWCLVSRPIVAVTMIEKVARTLCWFWFCRLWHRVSMPWGIIGGLHMSLGRVANKHAIVWVWFVRVICIGVWSFGVCQLNLSEMSWQIWRD